MNLAKTIAAVMIATLLQSPCAVNAAEEDRELSLIAAEQEGSDDAQLDELNPALTESLSIEREADTDKERRERRKKLREARREKEDENERKLRESTRKQNQQSDKETPIVIDPTEPESKPEPQPVTKPEPQPVTKPEPHPVKKPEPSQFTEPITADNKIPKTDMTPPPTTTISMPNQREIYANFAEVARAVGFTPLYMPRKSGYEITAIYAQPGIVEMQYGRRWEPEVSLAVRTHKRAEGEELRDISGVDGVKWRVDTTTGTTIYIAKISETQQVAAWAVGHYTFSALSNNLSFAGFHALVADELVELSTHYYLDL